MYMDDESGEHKIPTMEIKELEVGMEFINIHEFDNYIKTYAILKKFVWEYIKNDGDRARLKCHDKNVLTLLCETKEESSNNCGKNFQG